MSQVLAIHHVSLLVADLTRARAFYEGVLGMQPDATRPSMRFEGVWYTLGGAQIHLMCLPNPDAQGIRPAHGGRDRHLALLINDFDDVQKQLNQLGMVITLSQSGRRALFCRDPDNNALELIAEN